MNNKFKISNIHIQQIKHIYIFFNGIIVNWMENGKCFFILLVEYNFFILKIFFFFLNVLLVSFFFRVTFSIIDATNIHYPVLLLKNTVKKKVWDPPLSPTTPISTLCLSSTRFHRHMIKSAEKYMQGRGGQWGKISFLSTNKSWNRFQQTEKQGQGALGELAFGGFKRAFCFHPNMQKNCRTTFLSSNVRLWETHVCIWICVSRIEFEQNWVWSELSLWKVS